MHRLPPLLLVLLTACGSDDGSVIVDDAPGQLRIIGVTTGEDFDQNGYLISVAGVERTVPSNGEAQTVLLYAGDYDIMVSDVESNCDLESSVVRVHMEDGQQTVAYVRAGCEARVGLVFVELHASGVDLPTAGYEVRLDGVIRAQVRPDTGVSIADVGFGRHQVTLGNGPSNCTVVPAQANIIVLPNSTTPVTFTATCAAATVR